MFTKQPLKIVADSNIPFVSCLFKHIAQIKLKPGREITRNDLMDADILLVRTVTTVDESLLHGTSIQFVGSATAGFDHIDCEWLSNNHVAFANAKGVNAQAVAEYVLCCIASLQKQGYLKRQHLRIGIIGLGHIGSRLSHYAQQLGYERIYHDPIKAANDPSCCSSPLSDFKHLDLISIHASLTKKGAHPSYHMIDKPFLYQQDSGCILINTARGSVVDSQALLQAKHVIPCLDVWEHEPNVNPLLLERALIATPHIAGYSEEAKFQATYLLYEKACTLFNLPMQENERIKTNHEKININQHTDWQTKLLEQYDPMDDTQIMKSTLLKDPDHIANHFIELRKTYPLRSELNLIP